MKSILLSFIFLLTIQVVKAQTYQIDTIQYVGHSENFYDLIVMAEGYRNEDMDKFKSDVEVVKSILETNNAYSSMMDRTNIFCIRTPSVDEGISLISEDASPSDPIQVSDIKDTYFGVHFRNSYRAYFLKDTAQFKADYVASKHIPFYDVILILTNPIDDRLSGRATLEGIAVATRPTGDLTDFSAYIVNHELAHSIGGLSDAYSSDKEEGFNKTTDNNPNTIRWKDLLPLPDVLIDSVWPGVYIPNASCMMNSAVADFLCPVCAQRITQSMDDVSTQVPAPHRVDFLSSDTSDYTQTYGWEAVPGATHYEVIFYAGWRQNVVYKTVTTNQIIFDLSDEDFDKTIYNPNVPGSGSWSPSVIARAFNSENSSIFRWNVIPRTGIGDTPQVIHDVPELLEIIPTSPTSYTLRFDQDDNLQTTLIRIYNEDGHMSDLITPHKEIEVTGLIAGKQYQIRYAGKHPINCWNGNTSDFSGIMPLQAFSNDVDGDGYTFEEDCDDMNAAVNPGQVEMPYNGLDDDCDATTLDDDLDQDGFLNVDDCDDMNAAVNPGQVEMPYNGLDDDCDATTLDDDLDQDGFLFVDDCDDMNAAVNPGQVEMPYNGLDDDCDATTLDDDLDQDGFLNVDDCDDMNAAVNPGQVEMPYNGLDDDCDATTLDDDLDIDGFLLVDDCDDMNAAINPDATEIPNNGIDEDCDGEDGTTATHDFANTSVHFYPNPTSNFVIIDLENELNYSVQLFSLDGKKIFEEANVSKLDVDQLNIGTYLLRIVDFDTGASVIEKIVVAR